MIPGRYSVGRLGRTLCWEDLFAALAIELKNPRPSRSRMGDIVPLSLMDNKNCAQLDDIPGYCRDDFCSYHDAVVVSLNWL